MTGDDIKLYVRYCYTQRLLNSIRYYKSRVSFKLQIQE
jgi:hypothetical protein